MMTLRTGEAGEEGGAGQAGVRHRLLDAFSHTEPTATSAWQVRGAERQRCSLIELQAACHHHAYPLELKVAALQCQYVLGVLLLHLLR